MTRDQANQKTDAVLSAIRAFHTVIVEGSPDDQEIAWAALERITAALQGGLTNVLIAVARGTTLGDVESTECPGPLSLGVQEGSL